MRKKIFSLIAIFILVSSLLLSSFFSKGVKAYTTTNNIALPYNYGIVYNSYTNYSYSYQMQYKTGNLDTGYSGGYYKIDVIIDTLGAIELESLSTGASWSYTSYEPLAQNEYYQSVNFTNVNPNSIIEDYFFDESDRFHYTTICARDILLTGKFFIELDFDDDQDISYTIAISKIFTGYYLLNSNYNRGHTIGYGEGVDEGDSAGYDRGYNEGTADTETAKYWFTGLFEGFQGFLNIEIMGISIGTIILIPFAITFVWFIIRQFRGGGSS